MQLQVFKNSSVKQRTGPLCLLTVFLFAPAPASPGPHHPLADTMEEILWDFSSGSSVIVRQQHIHIHKHKHT